MQRSDIPVKLPVPFAVSAGPGYVRAIPRDSQIGINDGAASLEDGFVPLNATPIGAGGIPPDIKDMNGILREISLWTRWSSAGAPVYFDNAFSMVIGGYPKDTILTSATTPGVLYRSLFDDNGDDPDAGGANWQRVIPVKATNAEVIAGTDVNKFLTPASFFEARASAAQVIAGTDDHEYLTPLALAAAFGGSGNWGTNSNGSWFKLPDFMGGFIIQFGQTSASGGEGAYSVPLPRSFPTTFITAQTNALNLTGSSANPRDTWTQWWPKPSDLSNLWYVLNAANGTNYNYGASWIAIGK